MRTIVDDLAVEYKDEGQGPLLLMLHGWGNKLGYFDTLCAQLNGSRIVRLDLPGFGSSDTPHEKEGWSVERYATFVAAFCRKLQIGPDIILGHSLGGRILIKAAGKGILRPSKVVLIDAAGIVKKRTLRNAAYAATAKVGKYVLKPLPRRMYGSLRATLYKMSGSDYLTDWAMSPTFLQVVHEDLSADAAKIMQPTLIVWGDRDLATPLWEGEELHRLIANSTLHVLQGGHFIYRERPDEVAKLIREFV